MDHALRDPAGGIYVRGCGCGAEVCGNGGFMVTVLVWIFALLSVGVLCIGIACVKEAFSTGGKQ